METVFILSSLLVFPFWLLMIFVPHWRWTRRMLQSPLVAAPAAILYAVLVLPNVGEIFLEVVNPSLPAIAKLLGSPAGATIAWAHFLTFDLFVGRWVYLDSRDRAISAWLMAPVLFFILMLGPIGLLLYLIVWAVHSWRQQRGAGEVKVARAACTSCF